MKFLHTADWHFGKKLYGYELLTDQVKAADTIIKIAEEEKVDAIVIAGDLYDRGIPSTEAVASFNKMIRKINLEKQFPLITISGNHDSGVRLEAGGPWFEHSQFYLYTKLSQAFSPITIKGCEDTEFFLLPYFEPIDARIYYRDQGEEIPDDELKSIGQCVEKVVKDMEKHFTPGKAHVLVAHFFASGSEPAGSETKVQVGGLENVSLPMLAAFDYVALGHLHDKDSLKNAEKIKYSGSPLKFSLGEANDTKGVRIVETVPGKPLAENFIEVEQPHEIVKITASFEELTDMNYYADINRENYIAIVLTDREIIPNMMNQLRKIYPKILEVTRQNGRYANQDKKRTRLNTKDVDPQEIISHFFSEIKGDEMTEKQKQWSTEALTVALKKQEAK
jgi:exonuclease SbcD